MASLLPPLLLPQNAEQQGPEHATKLAWVVKSELRERFGLPSELPEDVQAKLVASVKAPKRKLGEPLGSTFRHRWLAADVLPGQPVFNC